MCRSSKSFCRKWCINNIMFSSAEFSPVSSSAPGFISYFNFIFLILAYDVKFPSSVFALLSFYSPIVVYMLWYASKFGIKTPVFFIFIILLCFSISFSISGNFHSRIPRLLLNHTSSRISYLNHLRISIIKSCTYTPSSGPNPPIIAFFIFNLSNKKF